MEEFLWVEKYRPKTIQDCILTKDLADTFSKFSKKGEIPNLLLSGSAGTGKTTVARALCEEIGADYIIINGSDEGRQIDTLSNKIKDFASTVSLDGNSKHKVVIIEGTWEDQVPLLDQRFDSIFFDDFPLYFNSKTSDPRSYKFCNLLMEKNINKNARFTHFCTKKLKNQTFTVIKPCRMNITRECEEFNTTLPEDIKLSKPLSFMKGLYIPLFIFNTGSPK